MIFALLKPAPCLEDLGSSDRIATGPKGSYIAIAVVHFSVLSLIIFNYLQTLFI
jgi:hypothetical protein